jgi:hypothetical protein
MVTYNQPNVGYNEGRYNAVTVSATASAALGGLTAVADAQPIPAPVERPVGGGRYPYRVDRRRVAVGRVVEPVRVPVLVEALCVPVVVSVGVVAFAGVTFSGEEDDLEVLLLL